VSVLSRVRGVRGARAEGYGMLASRMSAGREMGRRRTAGKLAHA
jgi:hypothetical protein